MTTEASLAGQTLGDRYDVLELLGSGGMGAVYRARDRELDELVALKVIRQDLAEVPEIAARFRQEVKLARRVTHQNVARTFELGHHGDVTFCTMELISGESLTRRLDKQRRLTVEDAVAIACALCDGLAAAHAVDVIHRDIKPDNVLIADDGRVVMADFGVAAIRIADDRDLSGTPAYMAPEQARGEPPTPAVDVYSVGVLLHEMVTGRRAFVGDAAKILADKQAIERLTAPDGVPAELAEVIGKATARDRESRFATATELRRALAPWVHVQRAATQPQRSEPRFEELRTVILLAPPGYRNNPRLYLAEAVYEATLVRLAACPQLRVLPRADARERGTVVVTFDLAEALTVTVARDGGPSTTLSRPLGVADVADTAAAISSLVEGAIAAVDAPRANATHLEAIDLMLQARHNWERDYHTAKRGIDQIERARALAPDEPRIVATYAALRVREVFYTADADPSRVTEAVALAQAALVAAPEIADAQLAAGHAALQTGDPALAAKYYRAAIARAPYSAEAHEYLGRMLLEAGYIDLALARLADAIAIQPGRRSAQWEIARAMALEGRWAEHDAQVAELRAAGVDRGFARIRYAAWRRDPALVQAIPLESLEFQLFAPGLLNVMVDVFLNNTWLQHRDRLLAVAGTHSDSRRRRTFLRQLVAEIAGYAGDLATAVAMIERAGADGLFDLHWLDHCPVLDGVRASPEHARLRAPIKQRAEAILDALYGDDDLAMSETAVAPRT